MEKSFLIRRVDAGTKQLGKRVEDMAGDLRYAGEQLRAGNPNPLADYLERGAGVVERFGRYLETSGAEGLVGDLEAFARQRPLALAATAAALGFATSRMLKGASARRTRESDVTYRVYDAIEERTSP